MDTAQPVVVRCLSCRAAVDRSASDSCPFCGTSLTAMPVIEAEAQAPSASEPEPIVAPVALQVPLFEEARPAPAVVARPPLPRRIDSPARVRRRRGWRALVKLVVGAALVALVTPADARFGVRVVERPAVLPSIAIPVISGAPAETARPAASPSPTPLPPSASAAVAVATSDGPRVCSFFTRLEIDRQYTFQRDRADIALTRARANSEHRLRLDRKKSEQKARVEHETRIKDAVDEHAATIAALDRRMSRAIAGCDPRLLF